MRNWWTAVQQPGFSTPQSCCLLLLPSSRIHSLSHSQAPGPCYHQWQGGKGVSFLFSNFQYNQKLSQDEQLHVPLAHSTLVLARIGWVQLTGGHPSLPFHTQLPDTGQEGHSSLAAAETSGYLDNRGFMRRGRRRYSSTESGGIFLQRIPCPWPQPSHSLLP
jgi:hypothetical protein